MPKKIRRTKPVTPIIINWATKTFTGFVFVAHEDGSVNLQAHWLVPQAGGSISEIPVGIDAVPIQAMAGFDAIVDAIVAASE